MIFSLPKDTWVDLYAASGIPVGTSLILNAFTGVINVSDSATEPLIDSIDIYPLPYSRTFSTILLVDALGAWAKSNNNDQNTRISVQINPNSNIFYRRK